MKKSILEDVLKAQDVTIRSMEKTIQSKDAIIESLRTEMEVKAETIEELEGRIRELMILLR